MTGEFTRLEPRLPEPGVLGPELGPHACAQRSPGPRPQGCHLPAEDSGSPRPPSPTMVGTPTAHRLSALFQHAWPHGALPPSPGPAQPGGRVPGRHLLLLRRVHQQVSALSLGRAWVGHALSRGGGLHTAGRQGVGSGFHWSCPQCVCQTPVLAGAEGHCVGVTLGTRVYSEDFSASGLCDGKRA